MVSRHVTIGLCALTGAALELGIHAVSGRGEAWDSPAFWTVGMPIALLVSLIIGVVSQGRDWRWTIVVAPAQVLTMMIASGEIGSLWPLALMLSSIMSLPFFVAAFIGSRFRSRLAPPAA